MGAFPLQGRLYARPFSVAEGIKRLAALTVSTFAAERHRLGLWSPVGLMVGIGWYFFLSSEPYPYIGAYMLAPCVVLLALMRRHRLRSLVFLPLLVALGFSAAQWRAYRVATPLLAHELPYSMVEGTIDEIEPVEKRLKLVLSHPVIEGVAPEETPHRLRVSFRGNDGMWQVGDRVRMQATLYPLPRPTMPGSYDFARHFYFRSIGGSGYAMRPPDIIDNAEHPDMVQWLNNLRHHIGDDMRAHMPGAVGTVAAAMTVGETGPIPAEIKSVLRDSGLAHMLAIAGLHLGIVAGIVFFTVRLLLTLWPPLALRVSAKKIAALLALASAFIYLLLAGCPIPAQRAFIMVAFLFMAVLFDRRGITLRTLAIAASFILLVFPEAMFGASFQMSFAATLAIVSLYEGYGRRLRVGHATWRGRIFSHALGIMATSLAATAATAPFVLYNFNRFALFGLISNMLVIPLATFVIMPGMVLALILMPLGWQAVGYAPLRYGVDTMISLSAWVTNLPHSTLHQPSPTDMGLVFSAVGLLWLCLMQRRWRLLGIPLMAAGLATMGLHNPPDMLVSDDLRQVMVRLNDGRYTLLKGTARSFTAQNWLRAEGQEAAVPLGEAGMECSGILCTYRRSGYSVVLIKKPWDEQALEAACAGKPDILIAWRYLHHYRCPGPVRLIGRNELETHGAYAFRLQPNGISMARTRETVEGRLWQRLFIETSGSDKEEGE